MNADGEAVGTSGSTTHSTSTFASQDFTIEDFRTVMVMTDTFCLREAGHQSSCAWPGFPNHSCPLAFRSTRSVPGSGGHLDSRAGIVRCAPGSSVKSGVFRQCCRFAALAVVLTAVALHLARRWRESRSNLFPAWEKDLCKCVCV